MSELMKKHQFLNLAALYLTGPAHSKKQYELDDENTKAFNQLGLYFCNDPAFETGKLTLNKGLCIIGHPGSGKSMMAYIFCRMFMVRFITCREVAHEFVSKGFIYSDKLAKKHQPILFDDLSREPKASYYANKTEIMDEIIQERYDLFVRTGIVTHFTTNKSMDQLKDRYGDHIESRLMQMCNFIGLGLEENSKDRRK